MYESNPVAAAVKRIGSSNKFFAGVILYSASVVLSLLYSILSFDGMIERMNESFARLSTEYVFIISLPPYAKYLFFVTSIPAMLMCIGLWMLVFVSRSDSSEFLLRRFTFLKAVLVIRLVQFGAASVFVVVLMVLVMSLFPDINGFILLPLLVFDIILIAAMLFPFALYYVKLIKLLGSARDAVASGDPDRHVSTFVTVMVFVIAGFSAVSLLTLLTSIASAIGFLGIVAQAAGGAATVILGLVLVDYKKEMQSLAFMPQNDAGGYQPPKVQ